MKLAIIGLILLIALVFVLLKGYVSPPVAFIVLPLVAAIIAGCNLEQIAEFMTTGVRSVLNTTVLFVFSISYFSLMGEAGLFTPLINWLTKKVGTNVYLVMYAIAVAAIIGHLDGSGSTTYLIVIPAFLPLCKRLHIRPISIFTTMTMILSWENLIPWGGPTMRAATVLEMEPSDYFAVLLPRMAIMAAVGFVMIFFIARSEVKNGAGKNIEAVVSTDDTDKVFVINWKYWFNLVLTVATIVILFLDTPLPLFGVFMIAYIIALVVNYPNEGEQRKMLKKFGEGSVNMTVTLLSVGVFLGVLNGAGMMEGLSEVLVNLVPTSIGRLVLVIFALLSMLVFPALGTDAFYFGFLPLVISAVSPYGVPGATIAATLALTSWTGILSPAIAASYLALGLLDCSFAEHVKYSTKYLVLGAFASLFIGILLGMVPVF